MGIGEIETQTFFDIVFNKTDRNSDERLWMTDQHGVDTEGSCYYYLLL